MERPTADGTKFGLFETVTDEIKNCADWAEIDVANGEVRITGRLGAYEIALASYCVELNTGETELIHEVAIGDGFEDGETTYIANESGKVWIHIDGSFIELDENKLGHLSMIEHIKYTLNTAHYDHPVH